MISGRFLLFISAILYAVMSSYKVIQDIEAEDKLIGPLTLRQFIYALVAALNGYLTFLVISKGAAFLSAAFLPIVFICLFFAWPWSRDQPTEVWALAKVRFMVKPRMRIWNQSGVKELVTITAPKRMEQNFTNGLSQNEVYSRLKALSNTLDSRGWAIKNVNVSMYGQPALVLGAPSSDRLVAAASLPQPMSIIDMKDSDDMLDVKNPVAQQFDSMMAASAKAHRQQVIDKMQEAAAPVPPPQPPQPLQTPQQKNDYWFLNQPTQAASAVPQDTVTFNTQVVAPGTPRADLPVSAANPTPDEESFIKQLKAEPAFSPNMHGHLHVIQPLSAQKTVAIPPTPTAPPPAPASPAPKVTQQPDAAILDLARNDDLNVATIAREANKRKESSQDEVVISLH